MCGSFIEEVQHVACREVLEKHVGSVKIWVQGESVKARGTPRLWTREVPPITVAERVAEVAEELKDG